MKKIIGIIIGILGVVIICLGVFMNIKGGKSVSIIGGADGPTSIFLAGKVGGNSSVVAIIIGVVFFVAGGVDRTARN